MDSAIKLENPLWDFALGLWKHAEAKQSLLSWQDQYGVRINGCIAGLWSARNGVDDVQALSNAMEASSSWYESKVLTLRSMRKTLPDIDSIGGSSFREKLLAAEISAEQIELGLIYQALNEERLNPIKSPDSERAHAARRYLELILGGERFEQERFYVSQVIACALGFPVKE